jgi:ADP-ribose pyrophosphatase YjhB (NUDIX family)
MTTTNYRQPHLVVVSALIQRGEDILLVEQHWSSVPRPMWTLPGGRVEPHETVVEALVREVAEETGLTVLDAGGLFYTLHYHNPHNEDRSFTIAFAVTEWRGDIAISDPDGLILRAEFMPRPQALELLEAQQLWPVIQDPLIAYLRGEVGLGAFWQYQRLAEGEVALMARLG